MAQRSLRRAARTSSSLSLTSAAAAAADVQELVGKEQECCAFLSFELRQDDAGIHLTITAPSEASEAADVLFAHFAPDLACNPEPETV